LRPDGTIFVKGELWDATAADGFLEAGEQAKIVAVEGFRLQVQRAHPD